MVAVPSQLPHRAPKDPSGIAVDRHGHLYVADGASIVRHANLVSTQLTIDEDGVISSNPIGAIAVANDGTIYVTRHGYGRTGAIMRVGPDGAGADLAGLSPTLFRYGIAYDPLMHALYATQYAKTPGGPREGAIVEIDLDTCTATTLVVGLVQPIGIVKLGSIFMVTDAKAQAVYRIDLREGRAEACLALAELPRPGAICVRGRDSVLVASYDDVEGRGAIFELWTDGTMRPFASGNWRPRGIACDGQLVSLATEHRILELPLEATHY